MPFRPSLHNYCTITTQLNLKINKFSNSSQAITKTANPTKYENNFITKVEWLMAYFKLFQVFTHISLSSQSSLALSRSETPLKIRYSIDSNVKPLYNIA